MEKKANKVVKARKVSQEEEEEKEAKRRLDMEIMHQNEEAQRGALVKAMNSDADGNKPSFNRSCLNVLSNFQGNFG